MLGEMLSRDSQAHAAELLGSCKGSLVRKIVADDERPAPFERRKARERLYCGPFGDMRRHELVNFAAWEQCEIVEFFVPQSSQAILD